MAEQVYFRRISWASLTLSFAVSLVVTFDAAKPVHASHFLTHPAGTPAAPNAPSLAAQAVAQVGARSDAQTRVLNAAGASSSAIKVFEIGAGIGIWNDAKVYLTPPNIPANDRMLERYKAGQPSNGMAQAEVGVAEAAPGLLRIAIEARHAQNPNGQNDQAYSLADAMRDAIWRRDAAARLRSQP